MQTSPVSPSALALQRLYHWETTQAQQVAYVQPMGQGVIEHITWRQAMDQVRRMAAHLQAQGFEPGSRIAILSKNTVHWLLADFAIWMAGHVSVPLYPTLAASTISHILQHSESKLLFVGKLDGWEAMKPGIPTGLPCIAQPLAPQDAKHCYASWQSIIDSTPPLVTDPVREGGELATIMYTSGTTGLPKGVMHSFACFARATLSGIERFSALNNQARVLSYLPLSHVAERMIVQHGQLATGLQVFFAESLDTFAADLQRARPTVFFSVPRLWIKFQQGVHAKLPPATLNLLLKLPVVKGLIRKKVLTALGLDQCQLAAGGAAPMPAALLQWYKRLGLDIAEVYGMTENCGISHSTLPGSFNPGTVGQVFGHLECRLDANTGEIQVNSSATMLGYYKEPQLTQDTFTDDGWLRTGDKGRLDEAGNLVITGRIKDLFKTSKGKYVAPAPIEDKLVTHPAIEACCVTGANMAQPIALLMLGAAAVEQASSPSQKQALSASIQAHIQAVNQTLDPHEHIACTVLLQEAWTVDNDLITPTMKVKRNQIEARYAQHYEQWVAQGAVVWG